ncbi:MAG: hypothetical protein BHW64_04500 [Candidatus Melainabacteria bacterium LEY3_CP_29_8]|nr:MAG: hypothetical protein BHW64_04500 [Candidatus Melainabacteria bacterium LEY3_CP_29_8]
MGNQDYIKLKEAYSNLFKLSQKVKEFIDKEDYNEVMSVLKVKDNVIAKINELIKKVPKELFESAEMVELTLPVRQLELENIKRIETLKDKVEEELSHLKNKAKLLEAYSNEDENKGSILDFKDE